MKRFLSLVALGVGVLVLTEVGLRFIDPPSLSYYRKVKLLHRYHPDYYVALGENLDLYIRHHNRLWEGRFTTNSLGFRGSPEPDPHLPILACLGDSMVMGFGVGDEDTFCHRLNGLQWGGRKFQTQNLAVDAYGSLGSAKRLIDSANKIPIDTVLFFVSANDFTVPPGLVEQGVLADDIVEKARENDEAYRRKFRIQFELTRFSYLLQAMKLAYEQLAIKHFLAQGEVRNEIQAMRSPWAYLAASFYSFPPDAPCDPITPQNSKPNPNPNPNPTKTESETVLPPADSLNPSTSMTVATVGKPCRESIRPGTVCLDKRPSLSELEPLPEQTIYAYRMMVDAAKSRGIRLIVGYQPMQTEDILCYREGKHSPLYDYALRSKKWFEENGIETMEFLEETRNICPLDDFFIPGDGHLTKQGNQWLSDIVRARLLTLPPQKPESPF